MPRIPLSLSVYEHAAQFLGLSPWEVSRDADLVYQAHRAAYELYRHFPVVVGIDIYNLEAEAYGCQVVPPTGNGIPAIVTPLCPSVEAALQLEPIDPARAGRIPLMLEAAGRLRQDFPGADVRLPVSGPFSIAQSLLGLDTLLLEAALRPDAVRELLLHLVEGQVRMSQAALAAGVGVAFFESAAAPPLLSPTQFREIELPVLREALRRVSAVAGQSLPCIIGGDTAPILPDILSTGTGFVICPAETDRAAFLEQARNWPDVTIRVNLDPRVYVSGTRDRIRAAVDEVVALTCIRPGLLLGTGAIPYETPPDSVLLLKEYCETCGEDGGSRETACG